MARLLTVPPYLANLWQLMKKLPDGEWVVTPNPKEVNGSRRYMVTAKDVALFRVTRLLEPEQSEALMLLIIGLRNAMPSLVMDMAKLRGVERILAVCREVAGYDPKVPIDEVAFTAQLAEALESFGRAESVVPRLPNERMTDWVDRVVYRLLVLERLQQEDSNDV